MGTERYVGHAKFHFVAYVTRQCFTVSCMGSCDIVIRFLSWCTVWNLVGNIILFST